MASILELEIAVRHIDRSFLEHRANTIQIIIIKLRDVFHYKIVQWSSYLVVLGQNV